MVGIDYCGRFIDTAMKIQEGKVVQYGSDQVAKLPSQTQPSRVQFKQVTRSDRIHIMCNKQCRISYVTSRLLITLPCTTVDMDSQ